MTRKIYIIHLPESVGGNAYGISSQLNKLGYKSETWSFNNNKFGYSQDVIISNNNDNFIVREMKRLFALRYLFLADIVFFNFGSTLFTIHASDQKKDWPWWKLLILKLYNRYSIFFQKFEFFILKLRKVLILVQYQGDDARQGDYCLNNYSISIAKKMINENYYTNESDELKRKQILIFNDNCFKIYALNPDLLNVLPKKSEFLPYSHISLDNWIPVFNQFENRPIRFGHAPSHRGVKGTEVILGTLDALKLKGYKFELILVEGLSNDSARKEYEKIDVLIDQIYAGWYGGVAVECMALGKPVLCYIRNEDMHHIPQSMLNDMPIIDINLDNIEEKLIQIITMKKTDLCKLAYKSRQYVEDWHNPQKIINRIDQDIKKGLSFLKKNNIEFF